jgi:hypothetical protein
MGGLELGFGFGQGAGAGGWGMDAVVCSVSCCKRRLPVCSARQAGNELTSAAWPPV